jgi:putative Mg2+ transporter-C (MgtC) family protein
MNQVLDSDIPIIVAYLLALPLAFERNARAETDIGLRTVPLVSVGACGYMLISRFLFEAGIYDEDGLSRTLRAVMTGIGFIGGGAIVKHAHDVQGLATGASVWSAGAIGASIAFGQYMTAVVLAISNVVILEIQRRLERRHLQS